MQKVTEEHAMEMLEILPPAVWIRTQEAEMFQVGEPVDHDEKGMPRFDTYVKPLKKLAENDVSEIGQWYYMGAKNLIE